MRVFERPSLRTLNTFGVDSAAALRVDIETEEDLLALPAFNPATDLVLGGGSNVLLATDVPGTVFLNKVRGITTVDQTRQHVDVEVGAGENWNELVLWSLEQGLSGLENLTLIPGSVGAAPMQNIGAYGVELSSVVQTVTAWDWQKQAWRVFDRHDCQFGYRDSLFKSGEPGRFLITSVGLRLAREFTPRLDYAGLSEAMEGQELTAKAVSRAVAAIRRRKLPDPEKIGNAGSFFKNPIVKKEQAVSLIAKFPGLPSWSAPNNSTKLSAAWMIEQCGLKGRKNHGAMVSEQHALVLVNAGDAGGADILELATQVQDRVEDRFGIRLDPEPRIIDFSDN